MYTRLACWQTHARCFGTVLRCVWWSTFALTSISTSYAQCEPATPAGKLLIVVTLLGGILALALPITVIGNNYQAMIEMHEEDERNRREAEQHDDSGDGRIDEMELREFLLDKKKHGELRKDVVTNPVELLTTYDVDAKGFLSMEEFGKLKEHVVDPEAADPQTNMRKLMHRSAEAEKQMSAMRTSFEDRFARLEAMMERLEKVAAREMHKPAHVAKPLSTPASSLLDGVMTSWRGAGGEASSSVSSGTPSNADAGMPVIREEGDLKA